jgi:hypothetical protein
MIKPNLFLLDLDGTIINGSLEEEYKLFIIRKYGLTVRYVFLGIIATITNKLLNIFFFQSVFSAWQLYSSHELTVLFSEASTQKIKASINYKVLDRIKEYVGLNNEITILILTGSPIAIVSSTIKNIVGTYLQIPEYRITVVGSEIKHGSFFRGKHYYGLSKVKYVLREYRNFSKTLCVGNEIADLPQRLIFMNMLYCKKNHISTI